MTSPGSCDAGGSVRVRAAVDLAVFLVVAAAWLAAVRLPGLRDLLDARDSGWALAGTTLLTGTVLTGVVALLVRCRRESWGSVGLRRAPVWAVVLAGVAAPFASFVLSFAALGLWLVLGGSLEQLLEQRMRVLGLFAQVPAGLVLPLAAWVAVYEEVVMRGFLLGRLRRLAAAPGASPVRTEVVPIVVSAAIFGAAHAYQGSLGVIQTGLLGLALGIVATWFRSVWPCIAAHFAIDASSLLLLKLVRPALDQAAS